MVCGKNLDGYPLPYIEWRDNNGTLVQTANATRYTFSNGPEVISLTINNTKGNDAGHWSCSVSVTGPNGEVPKFPLERIVELVVVGKSDEIDFVVYHRLICPSCSTVKYTLLFGFNAVYIG